MEHSRAGWISGLIGVIIFSASLPATKLAIVDFDPLFVTAARAAIAALAALALLYGMRAQRPERHDLLPLGVVAIGVVIGYPLLSALALRSMPTTHAIVFTGLLPLSTAIFGVMRGGERPRAPFWIFAVAGSLLVAAYALGRGGGASLSHGDALMVAAVAVCALGYAEGARLSKRLGGWQVISWALVLSMPVTLPLSIPVQPVDWQSVGWPALAALAYVSLFSMLIGFFFWYRGLALGGTAGVGQLQLLQPFLSLLLAAGLLGEPVSGTILAVVAGVVFCVVGAKRFSGPQPSLPAAASRSAS